tara:strand:- start:20 stop:715 length:696 start_codon:yes stop_codon:yes gene_type:complete
VNNLICIIPARKGSKRIKNKNIKLFYGKPIISHVIEKLKKFKMFSKIYVTTDCRNIEKIAQKYKIGIIKRGKILSNDFTDTKTVVVDAIKKLERKKLNFEFVCCVYPTSIFIKKKYFNFSLKKIQKDKLDFMFSAKKYDHSIFRSFYQGVNKIIFPIFKNKKNQKKRTQDFKDAYHDAGQFYLGHKKSWITKKIIINGNVGFIKIGKFDSIDIDNKDDWINAKVLWSMSKK